VFGVRVTTEDSYFVLDGDQDLPKERETSHSGGMLNLEIFQLSL